MKSFRVVRQMPLAEFLSKQPDSNITSNKQARAYIDKGLCRVNGVVAKKASQIVVSGSRVEIGELVVEKLACPILYEDEFFMVVNKPCGVTTDEKSIAQYIKKRFFLIHRLDKTTSGLLLLAKSKDIEEQFIELFRARKIQKEYLALVDGRVSREEGVIDSPIGVGSRVDGQIVMTTSSRGQQAITEWKRLKSVPTATLMQLFPKTGRTHQIRVHMQLLGHPILGDVRYAEKFRCGVLAARPMLHAYRLSFTHPVTSKEVCIEVLPPGDFLNIHKKIFGTNLSLV